MVDYESQFQVPEYAVRSRKAQLAGAFRIVYGWMCAGLAVSGLVAWYAAAGGWCQRVLSGPGLIACLVAEVALVIALSAAIGKMPPFLATLLFLLYAAVSGLTLSVVFVAYELALVQRAFFVTAGMFGGLALYGSVTKADLSRVGSICGMALWGLVLAVVVNLFSRSSGLDFVVSVAGVVIFTGLTMYDAQKVRALAEREGELDGATIRRLGILGALSLYLDFVNMFLYLLRFMGRGKD